MFWNDIEDINEAIARLSMRFDILDEFVRASINRPSNADLSAAKDGYPVCIRCDGDRVIDAGIEDIKELLCDVFSSEDENNTINRLHDKIDGLIKDASRGEAVLLAQKTLDKFDDYMKNVDKLNSMINEFKGCVAMGRASLKDRDEYESREFKLNFIYENMHKICGLYDDLCRKSREKSSKKKKATKARKAAQTS